MAATNEKGLTPKEELFCQLFASDREFFGNGTQSYIEAYAPDKNKPNWYQNARAAAYELLTKPHINQRINEIMEETGLNDVAIDKRLSFLIHQNADFGSSIAAIREYNKLKQRIIDKQDITSGGKPLQFTVVSYKDNDAADSI